MPRFTASNTSGGLMAENQLLRQRVAELERGVRKGEERRRALIHILSDYEKDRRRLEEQRERLDNSRRALLHILQDSHESKLQLERSRKAMIHIMGDLRKTTAEVEQREQELRDKQEQLVQAAKLETLGELTTGVAHELNNPLNNIGLYLGNIVDRIRLGLEDESVLLTDLDKAQAQVAKATGIISHLRTFGRVALIEREKVSISAVLSEALSLIREQLRLREITVETDLSSEELVVDGNAIQLEQVVVNLLTNARDAVSESRDKWIRISAERQGKAVVVRVADSGGGIPLELENRIFDPFFTTKDVGKGTGLGLSIAYGIIKEHGGEITVGKRAGSGAEFSIVLPVAEEGATQHGA